ncbi:MAG: hypothetical protein ABR572_07235 [Cryomorphaceae bacterium]
MSRNISTYFIFGLLAVSVAITGCETEVELTAPYKATPVITAVLNPTADTQFVRINKTFLGEGDVNAYAGIKDSVEYELGEVDAWLYKFNGTNLTDSFELLPIDIPSRNPGVFYDTDVRMYYTAEEIFDPNELTNIRDFSYELRAKIRGTVYTARTDFARVTESDISNPPQNQQGTDPNRLQLARIGGAGAFPQPVNVNFVFTARPGGTRYNGEFVLVYDEVLTDGTVTENKELRFNAGVFNLADGASGGQRDFNFNARNWFQFAGNHFDNVPNLSEVRIHRVIHRLTVANRDLTSYISVASPVSEFVPVFTQFTNFDNGAIGILGSIGQIDRIQWLDENSLNYLNNSEETGGTSFCVQWVGGTSYGCN